MKMTAERHMRLAHLRRFDSSDVVQQASLEAIHAFERFRGRSEGELLAWLSTILRRTLTRFAQHHTTKKRSIFREEHAQRDGQTMADSSLCIPWNRIPAESSGPVTRVIASERAILLARSLQQLPDNYRLVLQLRFIDGKKMREIADEMKTSVGTVEGLLRRALASLSQSLPPTLREEIEGADL
jgi:RNA polymerase sigma-70 factor (ECF subfamily)